MGELDEAVACHDEAVRLKPDYAVAWSNRAIVWNAKRERNKAVSDFYEAIRLKPDNAQSRNGRGSSRKAESEYDKAITGCRRVCSGVPGDS